MWNGIKRTVVICIFLLLLSAGASAENVGDVIGYVTGTDIVSYINNNPIPSFNINGYTAVMVSDLKNYGFDYNYNGYLRRVDLTFVGGKITPLQFWRDKRTYGRPVSNVLYTDIEVYADGVKIPGFNIDGLTAVYLSDLSFYGSYSYDDGLRSAFLTISSVEMSEYRVVEDRSTAVAEIQYTFSAKGYYWNYTLKIPVALYDYYSGIDRNLLGVNNYAAYAADTGDDIYISALADCFVETARKYGFSDRECVDMVINFVQSFDYVDDIAVKNVPEYPSFPIETLFEKQGDCEDTPFFWLAYSKQWAMTPFF